MLGKQIGLRSVAALVGAAFIVASCQPEKPVLSLDEAKKVTSEFNKSGFVAPPRTIADITAIFDQYQPDAKKTAELTARADANPAAGLSGKGLADFYYGRGDARSETGRINDAIADFEQAATLYQAAQSTAHTRALGELARAQITAGLVLDSMRTRERIIEVQMSDPTGKKAGRLIPQYALIALVKANIGDLPGAEASLARADDLLGRLSTSKAAAIFGDGWRTTISGSRGDVLFMRGDYDKADTAYRQAIDFALRADANLDNMRVSDDPIPKDNYKRLQIIWGIRLSRNLAHQNRLLEAEIEARKGLVMALKLFGRYNSDTAFAANQLARVLTQEGRFAEARKLGLLASDILTKVGHGPTSNRLAQAVRDVAIATVLLGDSATALKEFDRIAADLRDIPDIYRLVLGRTLEYGQEMLRADRAAEAEKFFADIASQRLATLGEKNFRTAMARGHLAAAMAKRGDKGQALALFRAAVPILLSPSRAVEDDSGAVRQINELRFVLESYLALLADIQGSPLEKDAGDIPATAFQVADAARGKSVQNALAASSARAAASNPDLADLVRREQDAQRQSAALQGLLVDALSAPPGQQDAKAIESLRTTIDNLRGARAALREEIEKRFPDYVDLIDPRPATIADAQKSLQPGEALVATYVATDRTYVWAVGPNSRAAFAAAPLGRAAIEATVRQLRAALDPNAATLGDIPPFDVALAHRLYAALLEPVAAGWRDARNLLIVPHGALGQLPFSVLVSEAHQPVQEAEGKALFAGYKTVAFLARKVAITQLPSVASLTALRRLPPGDAKRRAFVGFGDPWFNKQQAAEAASEQPVQVAELATRGGTALKTRGLPLVRRSAPATNTVDSAEIGLLPRLPDTAAEVQSVAAALHADAASDVLTGSAANEQAVKTMNLTDRRVVMFATHGLVPGDLNGLTQPALALSAPDVTGAAGDGLLTLDEIVGLRLNADWVVLSACNTASGDGAGAEAVSGLGRAFFYAGTRAVLVTNWPVETTSARALTTDMFRRQAADATLSRSQAMRQAMLALVDGPGFVDAKTDHVVFSYAHPIFWAPFSLVGDGGGGRPAS